MYYSSFGLLALVITVIIDHSILRTKREGGVISTRIKYKQFLICVILYYMTDILWGILYDRGLIMPAYADTVIYFAAMVTSVSLWTRFVVSYLDHENLPSRLLLWLGRLLMAFETVALVVNAFKPIVFYFDADNVYHAGQARYITLGLQILLFLAASAYSLSMVPKTEGKIRLHNRAIGFSGLVMIIFIILQTYNALLPFYAVGCLIATCLVHVYVVEDEKKDRDLELGTAKVKAYVDPLTGIGNINAYTEAKDELKLNISKGIQSEFAMVVFDLNNLKLMNDTLGHEAGDKLIQNAAKMICDHFSHSPVYRIGGDEFAAILTGEDYENREALMADFNRKTMENLRKGLVVVAGGIGVYDKNVDRDYDAVFERADHEMYTKKRELKLGR
ncbi:MAG: GGDEF domain-containing protein [Firmicutes bacterium]|nr:GGDEF domain-containing protein [Bacillota bacterium]